MQEAVADQRAGIAVDAVEVHDGAGWRHGVGAVSLHRRRAHGVDGRVVHEGVERGDLCRGGPPDTPRGLEYARASMARGVDALADVVIAPRSDHAVLTHRFVIAARLLHCRADGSLERARLERGPAAADAREVRAAVHTMAKVVARHALATVVRDRRVIERHA